MAEKRINLAIACCTLLAGGLQVQTTAASWNCTQDPAGGAWQCVGQTPVAEPEPGRLSRKPDVRKSVPETGPTAETRQESASPPGAASAPGETPIPREPAPKTTIPVEPHSLEAASEQQQSAPAETGTLQDAADEAAVTAASVEADAGATSGAQAEKKQAAVGTTEAVAPAAEIPSAEAQTSTAEADSQPLEQLAELDPQRLEAGLDWSYCGPSPNEEQHHYIAPQPAPNEPILMEADGATLLQHENKARLSGNVVMHRGAQHLEADRVDYDRNNGKARAEGAVLLRQPGLRVLTHRLDIDMLSRQAQLGESLYRLEPANARGSADAIDIESAARSHYDNIDFTTCPPESNAWSLQADKLTVDQDKAEAVARDARFRIGGVPLLYTPYLSIPLDNRRKSGFLIPSVGYSDKLGADLATPYYFNIAPEMDATLIPRYMSERGFMLGGEYRYLTAHEEGRLYGEFMPNDKAYEDGGKDRGGFGFEQKGLFWDNWGTRVNFNWVSDATYLEDFGDELNVTSTRVLERRADLVRYGRGNILLARVQDYQTLDQTIAPQDRPYSRLPQLLFVQEAPGLLLDSDLRLEAEYAYFDHSDKVHGHRFALRPSIAYPLRRSYGHLIPKATLHYAAYDLQDQTPGLSEQPDLLVPTLSLDGGLVYERRMDWLGEGATQTLEPRLFYLYAPYQDQDDLPLFDSAELDFSFATLFRENRFSGRDRVGDANQLTLALTSRTLADNSGRELFRASLGQILYFADRKVQAKGSREDDSSSALAGELAARLGEEWSSRAGLLWDPHLGNEQIRKASVGLHYKDSQNRLLNLAYRRNKDDDPNSDYEDTDLSFLMPIDHRWQTVGRWLYSLEHEQTMEAFLGVEYRHCCWRMRALVRQYVSSPDQQADLSFMLQFELTGLGAFGNNIQDFLRRGVYGYEVE